MMRVIDEHELVLCDRNIMELKDILQRKAPAFLPDAEVLLAELSYELIPAVAHAEKLMRDAKDQPILNAAIVFGVDIILTGDKDFLSLDTEHPRCVTAAEFLRQFSTGRGNYAEKRDALLDGITLDDIDESMQRRNRNNLD